MGHKVNPIGMRLQVNRTWDSRWYADSKDYGDLLLEDIKIRDFIKEECKQAGISRVIIERRTRSAALRSTLHVRVSSSARKAQTSKPAQENRHDDRPELHLNIVEVRAGA